MTDVQFKSIDCTEYIIFIILESIEKILHLASVWYAVNKKAKYYLNRLQYLKCQFCTLFDVTPRFPRGFTSFVL